MLPIVLGPKTSDLKKRGESDRRETEDPANDSDPEFHRSVEESVPSLRTDDPIGDKTVRRLEQPDRLKRLRPVGPVVRERITLRR